MTEKDLKRFPEYAALFNTISKCIFPMRRLEIVRMDTNGVVDCGVTEAMLLVRPYIMVAGRGKSGEEHCLSMRIDDVEVMKPEGETNVLYFGVPFEEGDKRVDLTQKAGFFLVDQTDVAATLKKKAPKLEVVLAKYTTLDMEKFSFLHKSEAAITSDRLPSPSQGS